MGSSTVVSQWESAGDLLSDTISVYAKSCLFLETFSLADKANAEALALRIDSSLNTLHTRLSLELARSRVTLAKIRNKIVSPYYSLPNEILAEIFMNVVYVPAPQDRPDISMTEALENIYRRLHSVLSVCTVWRNVGIEVRELWSVVPMGGGPLKCPSQLATSLSLERSGASPTCNRGVHLAVLLSFQNRSYVPTIEGQIPQFRRLNIESDSVYSIGDFFKEILSQGPLQNLSELSMHAVRKKKWSFNPHPCPPRDRDDITSLMPDRDSFTSLLVSVSILRTRGIGLNWDKVNFSNRLVEVRFQGVIFDSHSPLVDLLQSLETASELRDLKLISIAVFPSSTTLWIPPFRGFSYPKLESLLVEDMDFTALQLLLRSIAPGDHRLRLTLTDKYRQIYIPGGEPEQADINEIYGLLRKVVVDTLILWGNCPHVGWISQAELRGLLKSLLAMRVLKITSWDLSENQLLALKRPRSGKNATSSRFPNLDELHLVDVQIWETKTLKDVVKSHSLQKMAFNGILIKSEFDGQGNDFWELDENFQIVKWLKKAVPQFHRPLRRSEDDDFEQDVWRLW